MSNVVMTAKAHTSLVWKDTRNYHQFIMPKLEINHNRVPDLWTTDHHNVRVARNINGNVPPTGQGTAATMADED